MQIQKLANFLHRESTKLACTNQRYRRHRRLYIRVQVRAAWVIQFLDESCPQTAKASRLNRNKRTEASVAPRSRRVWINELITGRSAAVMARCCECRSPVSSSVFSVMEIARAFNHRASERRGSTRVYVCMLYALDFVGTGDSFVEFRLDRFVSRIRETMFDLSVVYLLGSAGERSSRCVTDNPANTRDS